MNILTSSLSLKFAVALAMSAAIAPAMAQSEQVQRGAALYEKNGCYLCHGTVGQGGAGPALAIHLIPYAGLSAYVRHPGGEMPPFSEKVLSDADLRDIYAYLGALPAPKSADSIPLLPKSAPVGGK